MAASLPSPSAHPARIPAWAALGVLVAAGAYLAVRWSEIPERWVIHWGRGGVPNGWATRSWLGVYGPLLVGLAVSVFVELVVTLSVRARVARDNVFAPLAGPTIDFGRIISLVVSLVCGTLAITLPLGPRLSPSVLVIAAISLVVVAIAIGIARVSRAVAAVRAAAPERFEGYHGLRYSNPNDSRLWVPKLMGMGWTINFAHPKAWPILILLISVPLVGAIATVLLAR